jgi:diguanylate cyclase (GGDEF)-like protein
MPGEKVLLVDTEKNVLLAYQAVLEEEGYKVEIATSKDEALEKLSYQSFSVLITEFYLKGKFTTELVKRVKQDYPEIYIIMISAITLKTDTYEEIINAGVDNYFTKPFSSRNLLVNIKKGLKLRALLMKSIQLEENLKNMELLFSSDPYCSNETKLLCNNPCFQQKLREEIMRAKRYNNRFSLLLFDLNSSGNGHKDLDPKNRETISSAVSHILLEHTRQTDVITQFDGSFALILLETSNEGTKILAERLQEQIINIPIIKDATQYQQITKNVKFDYGSYPEQSEMIHNWVSEAEKKRSN